jgi:hypothetical protein
MGTYKILKLIAEECNWATLVTLMCGVERTGVGVGEAIVK